MSFEVALRSSGLRPREVVADGRWRRCKTDDKPHKKNGAYVLYPDGRGYFKNWATDLDLNRWDDASVTHAPKIDLAAIAKQRADERRRRLAAIRQARDFWSWCEPMKMLHPYLERKELSAEGCAGLRVSNGELVVPVYWGERITSIQKINADGEKRFWPGAPVKAGAYILNRKNAAVTAVCEGLATGLAIYQSMRAASVIVAFDAGNLIRVIERIKPTGNVVVCADNDHRTQEKRGTNPGIEKATNAAELIGAGVAWPEGINGTDWADALKEGIRPRQIERLILGKAKYVMR